MKKLSFIVIAGLALSGCSSTTGDSLYLNSRDGVRISVPYPLTTANMSSFYDLPQQNGKPGLQLAPSGE